MKWLAFKLLWLTPKLISAFEILGHKKSFKIAAQNYSKWIRSKTGKVDGPAASKDDNYFFCSSQRLKEIDFYWKFTDFYIKWDLQEKKKKHLESWLYSILLSSIFCSWRRKGFSATAPHYPCDISWTFNFKLLSPLFFYLFDWNYWLILSFCGKVLLMKVNSIELNWP